jgi:hypothetical protein
VTSKFDAIILYLRRAKNTGIDSPMATIIDIAQDKKSVKI